MVSRTTRVDQNIVLDTTQSNPEVRGHGGILQAKHATWTQKNVNY